MTAPAEPTTDHARSLRKRVSEERWVRIVAEAKRREEIYEATTAWQRDHGGGLSVALAEVAVDTPRPTFVYWQRHVRNREGPIWERLLDGRVPPDRSCSSSVRAMAVMARMLDKDIAVGAARDLLKEHFGDEGDVSASWLKRVWAEAGVNRPGGAAKGSAVAEQVEHFHGGGGLALIAAAEQEVGAVAKLAAAIKTTAAEAVEANEATTDTETLAASDAADRDARGRFTPAYNGRRREGAEPGQPDDRWHGDADKAKRRELSEIELLKSKPQLLAARLMAMGTTSLLTERRGFDGLDGPAGAWLAVYGATAYMPATLDKTLAELALFDVDKAMWAAHARVWSQITEQWRSPSENWPRTIIYVDGTTDPFWTHKFALSGKVSRVGRVMPCLTRVVIHSGAGVPLLVETHAGTASLKKRLLPVLEELDEAIGPGADVGRLTVIDSEVGVAGLIWAMHDQTEMLFITIIKGPVLAGARFSKEGAWQPFRARDEVRDVEVHLRGKGAPAGGIVIRGVQMRRCDGRNPKMTVFVTNTPTDEMSPMQISSAYLERWPRQEAQFANARNGGGLNRSFGYGGELVANIALESKVDRAKRSVAYAEKRTKAAIAQHEALGIAAENEPSKTLKKAVKQAESVVRDRRKKEQLSADRLARLQSQPNQIYRRDIGRDSVMTCLKLTLLSLIEFVMQEYFGGSRMQWRTFIEQFVALPVTVRTTKHRRIYEIHANLRQLKRMEQLQAALAEVNRRELKQGERRLEFKLVGMPQTDDVQGSG